jgi:hypothetical protein
MYVCMSTTLCIHSSTNVQSNNALVQTSSLCDTPMGVSQSVERDAKLAHLVPRYTSYGVRLSCKFHDSEGGSFT